MIFELRNGRIAPRIAFALIFRDTYLAANVFMQVIGSRFRGLDGEPVGEVSFGVIVRGLEFVEAFSSFLPNGDDLEGDHVHLT